ncbi:MAG: hypothetical protein Q9195_005371 [Heterodermia aff. obscurata]
MPLHLRNLLGRSRSRSSGHRTDLCRTYTLNSQEREAQGYLSRSDWNWHNGWLLRLIQNALQESDTTDWREWTVQSECRTIRQCHFEDLDMDDQALCVIYWRALSQLRDCLRPYISSDQSAPVEEVIAELGSFTQQAEQLYGVYPYTEVLLDNVLRGEVFIHGSAMSQLYPFLVLLLTILNADTLAQPINTTVSSTSHAHFACTGPQFAQVRRSGKPENCARAIIAAFPLGDTSDEFHHGLEGNPYFRLPRASIVGDCEVSVDLSEPAPVQGSWNEVWTMANTLSTACTYYRAARTPESAVTGGYIVANGLVVVMQKPLTVGNTSDVAAE